MSGTRTMRGQPLAALIAVLVGWTGGRATSWEPPAFAAPQPATARFLQAPTADFRGSPEENPVAGPQSWASPSAFFDPRAYRILPPPVLLAGSRLGQAIVLSDASIMGGRATEAGLRSPPRLSGPAELYGRDWLPPGQFADSPAPRFFAPELAQAGDGAPPLILPPPRPRRWSADAWALLRGGQGGAALSPGALPATYGASQAGAVLRYRLAPSSPLRPAAYMRTTSSLGQYRETAAALGLSARPFPRVPLVAALEGRLTEQLGERRLQPAAFAYSELPVVALPAGLRGEAYLQGGYVGGRFATLFADGQVRIDRGLWQSGPVEARLGGGLWGGAQRDAARLDAGPSAAIALPLGRGTFGRVAVDWRFRVAGDAAPDSGPAVTLSAGF